MTFVSIFYQPTVKLTMSLADIHPYNLLSQMPRKRSYTM